MSDDFIKQCETRVPELEIAEVVSILNVHPEGAKFAMMVRRLAFQRDQLEKRVEYLKGLAARE